MQALVLRQRISENYWDLDWACGLPGSRHSPRHVEQWHNDMQKLWHHTEKDPRPLQEKV